MDIMKTNKLSKITQTNANVLIYQGTLQTSINLFLLCKNPRSSVTLVPVWLTARTLSTCSYLLFFSSLRNDWFILFCVTYIHLMIHPYNIKNGKAAYSCIWKIKFAIFSTYFITYAPFIITYTSSMFSWCDHLILVLKCNSIMRRVLEM